MKAINHHETLRAAKKYLPDKPIIVEAGALDTSLAPSIKKLFPQAHFYTFEAYQPKNSLDEWAHKHNIDHIDLLLLNQQKHDFDFMTTSPRLINTVKALIITVDFTQNYKRQAEYHEIKEWLEAQGFNLIGKSFDEKPSRFFDDALFIRKEFI